MTPCRPTSSPPVTGVDELAISGPRGSSRDLVDTRPAEACSKPTGHLLGVGLTFEGGRGTPAWCGFAWEASALAGPIGSDYRSQILVAATLTLGPIELLLDRGEDRQRHTGLAARVEDEPQIFVREA